MHNKFSIFDVSNILCSPHSNSAQFFNEMARFLILLSKKISIDVYCMGKFS